MRPTSDARDETEDRDHYNAETARSDPWAGGPGHLNQDEPTERYVPEQRDSDHDGHLYASDTYAEPETEVLTGQERSADERAADERAGDEPTAVGVAHVDADAKADEAEAKADEARETAEEARAEAHATDTVDDTDTDTDRDDEPVGRHEPEVETVALPPAAPVVVVEPVGDRPGDLAAVPVERPTDADEEPVAEEHAHEEREEHAHDAVEETGELKPGDVPVAPVAGFLTADAAQGLRDRWREAQLGFVDDPRQAVEDVKALVSEAVDQFTSALSAQRDDLDAAAGEDTEQYRVAVQRYRTFFDRLLDL
jgi:hypothetical protein